jgi:hypothetical protein
MAGHSLNATAVLQCPHGGVVQIGSMNGRVLTAGAPMALFTDVFTVSGCPLPSPCVLVRWLTPDMRVKVNRVPTLSRSSVGICQNATQVPQGPVVVSFTQVRTQSQ